MANENESSVQTLKDIARISVLFTYEDHTVRVVLRDGRIWFVAKDIGKVVGMSDLNEMMDYLGEEEMSMVVFDAPGKSDQVVAVTESGVYGLTSNLKNPEAKEFRYWITHVVIASVRNTGMLPVQETTPKPAAEAMDIEFEKYKLDHMIERDIAIRRMEILHNTIIESTRIAFENKRHLAMDARLVEKNVELQKRELQHLEQELSRLQGQKQEIRDKVITQFAIAWNSSNLSILDLVREILHTIDGLPPEDEVLLKLFREAR